MASQVVGVGPRMFKVLAEWTDRIAAGEVPPTPPRPQGVERNVVISMWDWSNPKTYLHDAVSSDKRNPALNANGLIYGSPEEASDQIPVLDPVHFKATTILEPYLDQKMPGHRETPLGPSAY